MNANSSATEIAQRSLDAFLAKDMKAWSELCDPKVIVEFPFAPEGAASRLEGRAAIYEYLKDYPSVIIWCEAFSVLISPADLQLVQ